MLRGSIPALVTPFAGGKVDEKALVELVEWQIAEGSHGLVPVGTTGESPTLTHDEHEHVIEVVVKTARGRVPVIAGAGSNNTEEAIRLMRFARKVGADAALVVTPYYNKPNQRGLLHHYKALHDAVDLPIVIYNIPGRSVIDMTPATMGELARLPRIVGVKDATGDVTRVSDTRISCGPDFIQLSGEDASCRARTRARSGSTPRAGSGASPSWPTSPRGSAPRCRRRRWPATTARRSPARTG